MAPDPPSVLVALKRVKHQLIGHDQMKDLFVRLGIVPLLVQILGDTESREWQDIRVEAGFVVGSLAYGGESHISHLLSSNILPPLIASLNPSTSPPKLVLSTLRTLNTIYETTTNPSGQNINPCSAISSAIYTPEVLKHLCTILSQTSSSTLIQQQITLASSLIATSCGRYAPPTPTDSGGVSRAGMHQRMLVDAGVLDALASRLGGFVVAEKSTPRSTINDRRAEGSIPPPAPPSAKLAPILDAISATIKDSKIRALEFMYSPAITALFPPTTSPSPEPEAFSYTGRQFAARSASTSSINMPLPKASSSLIQPPQLLITPSAFPPLSAAASISHYPPISLSGSHSSMPSYGLHHHHHHHGAIAEAQSLTLAGGEDSESLTGGDTPLRQRGDTVEPEERGPQSMSYIGESGDSSETEIEVEESPLIPWLIHQVRSGDSLTRLMAANVLTNLFRVGLMGKKGVNFLVLLVLPILVRILGSDDKELLRGVSIGTGTGVGGVNAETWVKWTIQERTPAILARLVMDNPEMQKAAVDAGAIKRLGHILRRVAEPVYSSSTNGTQNGDSGSRNIDTSVDFGVNTPEKQHRMRVKEGVLRCIANLASFKDEYRKAIIDAGVVQILVASMKPLSHIPSPLPPENNNVEGNPSPVLTAACGAIRALSRSVSILRTSLIDAGVAIPLFVLLNHPDMEVKIASTAAVCNLVLEFSPMKQKIVEAGVLEILCAHAKSDNSELRLNAVWALKHLVLEAEHSFKQKCFDTLGAQWLLGIITCDEDTIAEREDEEMGEGDDDGDKKDGHGEIESTPDGLMGDGVSDPRIFRKKHGEGSSEDPCRKRNFPPKAAVLLQKLENIERDEGNRVRREEIRLQEQCLDFIRNFICGKDGGQMIDLLFETIGQDHFFRILEARLSPRINTAHSPFTSKRASTIDPPSEIVQSTVYIIVSIAAIDPRHRQTLIEQTNLLKLLLPLWNHRLTNVRVGFAWVVINLTWMEEGENREIIKARARELKRLGFVDRLDAMSRDSELDVRERVKSAKFQLGECGATEG
ncbi:hypothetical protein RUND412_000983 [Rhizina undulata]